MCTWVSNLKAQHLTHFYYDQVAVFLRKHKVGVLKTPNLNGVIKYGHVHVQLNVPFKVVLNLTRNARMQKQEKLVISAEYTCWRGKSASLNVLLKSINFLLSFLHTERHLSEPWQQIRKFSKLKIRRNCESYVSGVKYAPCGPWGRTLWLNLQVICLTQKYCQTCTCIWISLIHIISDKCHPRTYTFVHNSGHTRFFFHASTPTPTRMLRIPLFLQHIPLKVHPLSSLKAIFEQFHVIIWQFLSPLYCPAQFNLGPISEPDRKRRMHPFVIFWTFKTGQL